MGALCWERRRQAVVPDTPRYSIWDGQALGEFFLISLLLRKHKKGGFLCLVWLPNYNSHALLLPNPKNTKVPHHRPQPPKPTSSFPLSSD